MNVTPTQIAPAMPTCTLQAESPLGTRPSGEPRTITASALFRAVEEPFLPVASLRLPRHADRHAALRAWPEELPLSPNRWTGDVERSVAHFEPNAWMLLGEWPDAAAGAHGWLLTDLSSRLASFRLGGARVTRVLASATAATTAPQGFVRTFFAEAAPVLIQRLADHDYRVLIDVSLAHYLASWLAEAGHVHG